MLGVLCNLESVDFYKLKISDNKPQFSKINVKINNFESLINVFRKYDQQLKSTNQQMNKNNIENLYKFLDVKDFLLLMKYF